jgi:hypothetical protein
METSPEVTRRAPLLTEAPPSPMHDAEEMEEIECGRVEAVCRCCGACQGGPQHDAAAANQGVVRLLAWVAMNVLVYVGQRLAVAAGLPADGIDPAGRRATFILASVQMLVLHACGTAIFAHVLAPERRLLTRWTANAGFFVVASVTGIVFSALSDLTQLETSLSSRGGHSAAYVVVMCIVAFFVLLGLWFHVWYAQRSTTKLGVVPYLAPRMAVVSAYAAYIIILDFNNDAWELHHYLIAWIGTLFCAFDHPASVVCLAITTGIFVQGLAAYGPAEISDRRAEYVDWSPDGPT